MQLDHVLKKLKFELLTPTLGSGCGDEIGCVVGGERGWGGGLWAK